MGYYTDHLKRHKREILNRFNAMAQKGPIPLSRTLQLIKEWFYLGAWARIETNHRNLLASVPDFLTNFMPIHFGHDREAFRAKKIQIIRDHRYPEIADLLDALNKEISKIKFEAHSHELHNRFLEALLLLHPFSMRFFQKKKDQLPTW